eukprot:CAMPEP_0206141332 /NCGR_PEP_ID=MMETSP1473-20131121/12566_1 /ASSEMBLY_ACC=CAM_ASM_001109 /TAXON_ID=1461547 /ORGANISM="Stichococcus sp, Strain RCC1054" /LENGTH=62 /DNA_ID=CAMNT_0053535851 /DNA_START=341 /DNA_END=525 /DNA_ORIENTATION=-
MRCAQLWRLDAMLDGPAHTVADRRNEAALGKGIGVQRGSPVESQRMARSTHSRCTEHRTPGG